MENVRAQMGHIPLFQNHQQSATVERLGGLTNLVYLVTIGDRNNEKYVLRVPGAGSETLIDRDAEKHTLNEINQIGVSPELLYYGDDSVMVTKFISGTTASADYFASTPGSISRTAKAIKSVHDSGREFKNTYGLFDFIASYQKYLDDAGADYPDGFDQVMAEIKSLQQTLENNPAPFVPSHCDISCENIIDDGTRAWLIDWEYAAMNDPLWDLGYLSVEGDFTDIQDEELLRAYFGASPAKSDHGRMIAFKALSHLISMLWGLIQLANGNPVEDFKSYAQHRFNQCKKMMDSPEFANYVAAI